MTAMRQLFPIADDIRALDALLDECDGELLSPEAEAAFVALAESLAQEEGAKLDNCVNYQRRRHPRRGRRDSGHEDPR